MDSPATKRTRDSLLESSLSVENRKQPRISMDSPFRAMQALESRFDKLTEKINTTISASILHEIRECEKRIISEINNEINNKVKDIETKLLSEIDSLKAEFIKINNRISSVETQCSEIDDLRKDIDCLKTQLYVNDRRVSKQENAMVSNELRVTGIPKMENENLRLHYANLCAVLEIHPPECKSIFRVGGERYRNNSPDSTIIIKMESAYDKNFLLRSMYNYRNKIRGQLQLNAIGFESDATFFINENLTSNNYHIFKSALKLKKMKKLSSVFTRRGLVYIKVNTGDEATCASSIDELNVFFRS